MEDQSRVLQLLDIIHYWQACSDSEFREELKDPLFEYFKERLRLVKTENVQMEMDKIFKDIRLLSTLELGQDLYLGGSDVWDDIIMIAYDAVRKHFTQLPTILVE